MNKKLAIVTDGGGMNCAYSAGALYSLARNLNLVDPDLLIGCSGSTASLAYYLAEQYDALENIWTNLLTSKRFVSLWRLHRVMDIDYLIDEVFKKQAPLDVGRIARSQSRLLISVTEHQTGRVAFLHNHRGLDLFEILRASKAIPLVYRKKVTINGVAYVDGSIGMPLAVGIQKAIAEGAGNIIVIRNGSGASMASTLFWRLHAALENDHLARAIGDYLSQQHLEPQVNAGIRMVVIDPSRPLPTHPLDNRRDHLRAAFDLGGEDIRRNSELAMLLDSLNG